ncbi:MAG: metallophosphoesterase [Haloarculaceae archaeon]
MAADVEPLPDRPAAVATLDGERTLLVADYHAGLEERLRREGVELDGRGEQRRRRLLALLDEARAERLAILGDLGHAIGDPGRDERAELTALFEAIPADVAVTVVAGNHDGDLAALLDDLDREVRATTAHGIRLGDVGLVHGHTWPSPHVLEADVVCMGHEHPVVRIEDEVGGVRKERVWLRGRLHPDPFVEYHDRDLAIDGDLVVFPAFNDLSGGTWINVEGQSFLSPFLPDGLADGEAYMLDGTRLGPYREV